MTEDRTLYPITEPRPWLAWGEAGPPVLLLHGLTGRAALWAGVARRLAARGFRVIAPDLRGHGALARAGGVNLAACVRDILELIAGLGLAPCHLVGHSFGAVVAWEVAASRPAAVDRMVLEDQPPAPPPEGWQAWLEWAAGWPVRFPSREAAIGFLKQQGRSLAWWEPMLTPLPDGGWGWAFDIPGVMALARELYHGPAAWERLAAVQAPTLVIRGALSSHLLPEVARQMVATLPRGRLVTVPGADHWVHRQPESYADLVAGYLGERPLSP